MTTGQADISDKKLTILCLSEHYFPLVGGTVTYVDNLCENMAQLGQRVFLATYTDNAVVEPNNWVNHGSYSVYNLGLKKNARYNTRRARRQFCSAVKKQLPQLIAELKPDLIHILYGHYLPRAIKNGHPALPLLWTIQNVPPREYAPLHALPSELLNRIFTQFYFFLVDKINAHKLRDTDTNAIIAVSTQTNNLLRQRGVAQNKIFVIPDGINEKIFHPATNQTAPPNTRKYFPIILCAAGVARHKGQIFLVRAMRQIVQFFPTALFINIGPTRNPQYAKEIYAEIEKYSLQNNCRLLPEERDANKMVAHYRNCDIYAQPSLEEGFCMAVLEAACCGKPVVGTATGAIPEIIETAGLATICQTGDSDCLAKNILTIANMLQVSKYDADFQFKKLLARYSWRSVALGTVKLYRQILTQRR